MNASLHVFSGRSFQHVGAPANLRLRVGEHVVDLGALRVVTNPAAPRLTSKAASVLIELASHAGDTLTRDDLLDRVWKDRVTTPDVLTQAIKDLRRAFGDDTKPSRYIETIPKVGYRLLAPVSEINATILPVSDAEPVLPPANDDTGNELPAHSTGRFPVGLSALALLALVAIGIAVLLARSVWAPAARAVSWNASDIRAVTSDPGPERRPRISPDGTRIVYSKLDPDSGFERLVVRGVDPSQALHPTRRAMGHEEMAVWSPDGTRIAFERLDKQENCTLYIVPSMGGADDEVGPCGDYRLNYFDWSPDGRSLIVSDQQAAANGGGMPIALLDLASGALHVLKYQRAPSDQDLDAHYSPDGRWIAFRRGLSPHSDLFVMAADGGGARALTHIDARIAGYTWTPDGATVVFAGNQDGAFALYAVDVRDGAVQALGVKPAAYPNMPRNGSKVVYEIQRTKTMLAAVPLLSDADSAATPNLHLLARSTGSDTAPAISPDGKQVAFVSDRSGAQEIWLSALDEATEPLVLTDYRDAVIANPTWSNDGSRVLVSVRQKGKTHLVEIEIASRRNRIVAASQAALLSGDYGPQADSYLVVRRTPDAHSELVLLEHADSPQEHAVPVISAVEHVELDRAAAAVYYTKSDASGLYRRALAGGDEQLVTRKVTANIIDGWRVIDRHVWYVSGMMQKPFDLRELDPSSGIERVRAHVDAWLRDVNFDLSPERDRVLLAPMGPEDIDVGAFTLERS